MALFELPLYSDARFRYVVDLGGQAYTLRFDFKERLGRLYLTVEDASGRELLIGQGLAGGGSVSLRHRDGFPGFLYLAGPGRYTAAQLAAGEVKLFYQDGES